MTDTRDTTLSISKEIGGRLVTGLLNDALDLAGEARQQFLEQIGDKDSYLRQEVESLLAEEEALEQGFMGIPVAVQVANPRGYPSQDPERLPQRIGRYRILRLLGRGGMGSVFLAEQDEPVKRRVALKVAEAPRNMDLRRRFASEIKVMARLEHPNVASMYESGITPSGEPFVAMEWLEGSTLLKWCTERRLDIDTRIQLILDVCAGIGHAHQKGILHLDLKPSNVLVTEIDGRSVAKVIDFGVARAIDPESSGPHHLGALAGSPPYMSPETLAHPDAQDVDTRSDVYSIGLMLYELLVGELPITPHEFQVFGAPVRSSDPFPAASVRWQSLEPERRQSLAEERQSDARAVRRRLSGDLDAILLRATAYQRSERYATPADLADDLRRHLDHEPVEARPPRPSYRLGRFVRRNRGSLAALALLIVILTMGTLGRLAEADRATREAERANQEAERALEAQAEAEELSDFLVGLFRMADPDRRRDTPLSVRELLDRAVAELPGNTELQPRSKARFLYTLGQIQTSLAEFELAEALFRQALEIRRQEFGDDHPEVAEAAGQLGIVYRHMERLDEAEALLQETLRIHRSTEPVDPVLVAAAFTHLANVHWQQKRHPEAEAGHRQALALRQEHMSDDLPAQAESLNNLGVALRSQEKWDEAGQHLRQAAEIFAKTLGPDHPRTATSWFNLGIVERALGNRDETERLFRLTVELWEQSLGPDHPNTRLAKGSLAELLAQEASDPSDG